MSLAIGVDLGGTNLRGALVHANGRILKRFSEPTSKGRKKAEVVRQIISLCHGLAQQSGTRSILGIGVGAPGFLDHSKGWIHTSPNFPDWKNFRFQDVLRKRLRWPVWIENDANCAALGEHWRGAARNFEHAIVMTLGTGVGGGVIVEGKLLRGHRGCAGEVGHIVIDSNGPPCGCGGRGCLESFASDTALRRETGKSGYELAQLARHGNRRAKLAFERMGKSLGAGISSLCFLFDPQVIILGGRLTGAISFFGPAMRKELKQRLRRHPSQKIRIQTALCGDDAGILGAAKIVFNCAKRQWEA